MSYMIYLDTKHARIRDVIDSDCFILGQYDSYEKATTAYQRKASHLSRMRQHLPGEKIGNLKIVEVCGLGWPPVFEWLPKEQ